jgi:uncharacterized protein involved in outer membrane biogenesis
MYDFAPKFRYLLRWLLRGAAFLGLIAALFAALPFLLEDRVIREGLIKSLSEWSGGPVAIHGPLHIGNFSALTVEANNVSFGATPRLAPVNRIEAKSVKAVLKLPSLLWGRAEFKKVTIETPRFVLSRSGALSKPRLAVIEAADAAAGFASLSRFRNLELRDCTFIAASGERRAYSRYSVDAIGVAHEPGSANFTLSFKNKGLDANFRGALSHAVKTATGAFSLKVPAEHKAAARIVAAMAPWEKGNGASLAGDLIWSANRLTLDADAIGFGSHSAKGSLAFGARQGRTVVEGTLAYDTFEWMPAAQEDAAGSGSAPKTLDALIAASSEGGADFDMRISAERLRAGPYDAGPLALSLTARPNFVSADVAELGISGGRIAGRFDFDARRPFVLTANVNGTQLDSAALAEASALPVAVAGPINFHAALEIPFKDRPILQELKSATGSFGIVFPAGGTLNGEVSKHLSEAFAQKDALWGLGSTSIPFNAASVDGIAKPGSVALKLNGEAAGGRVAGALRVATPGGQISGTLTVHPVPPLEGALPAPVGASASIGLSGTAAALNFSALNKTSLPN